MGNACSVGRTLIVEILCWEIHRFMVDKEDLSLREVGLLQVRQKLTTFTELRC